MAGLPRIIADMARAISELHRRQANMIRAGRVVEVDPAAGTVRIDVGSDGAPLVTPPIRWPERAGARSTWNPPTVGEDMTVFSPTGKSASALLRPMAALPTRMPPRQIAATRRSLPSAASR